MSFASEAVDVIFNLRMRGASQKSDLMLRGQTSKTAGIRKVIQQQLDDVLAGGSCVTRDCAERFCAIQKHHGTPACWMALTFGRPHGLMFELWRSFSSPPEL